MVFTKVYYISGYSVNFLCSILPEIRRSDAVFRQRPDGHAFLCKLFSIGIFEWLYLAYYLGLTQVTPNLGESVLNDCVDQ